MQQIACRVVRETPQPGAGTLVTDPTKILDLVAEVMNEVAGDEPREIFVVFHLNSQNMVVSWEIVSMGILDSTLIHPREIFRSAILKNAAAIILAHNHPSGMTEPSMEDINVTRQLVRAGDHLGIPVVDHVITGHSFETDKPDFVSMAARGLLRAKDE